MTSFPNNQRVLIVGGAGFVGSNLVKRLLVNECRQVTVVDNFLSSERENLPEDARLELRAGSIADDEILSGLIDEYDYVFHLATYHGNQSSIANPLADHDNNLITTLKLFERLKDFRKLKRVVYVSTGCALAAKTAGPVEPVVEDGPIPLDFDSPYQISKVVGEMYAVYYHHTHHLPVVRARFQNVYGPGEVLGAGQWRGTPATIWRNVTPTFIYRAIKKQPLQIHGQGESTRDLIYVDDIIEGLLRCALTVNIEGDVFNLASGVEVSILKLARLINELTGNPAGIDYITARAWDRSINRFGSTAKAKECLDFESKVPLQQGLANTISWTMQNMPHIERCIKKHQAFYPVEF
jgi:nucleoside-diphosphate-sugar epimerase